MVNDVTRESLAATPDTWTSVRRMAWELSALIAHCGQPGMIISDSGAKFTSIAILTWAEDETARRDTRRLATRPVRPMPRPNRNMPPGAINTKTLVRVDEK